MDAYTVTVKHFSPDVVEGAHMITAAQMRAARALLNIDQRLLAELSGLSLPTIRGNVDSLVKLIGALEEAGVELINDGATSHGGGRGVRFRETRRDREAFRRRGSMSSGSPGPRAA
jgi:hypothetical protein